MKLTEIFEREQFPSVKTLSVKDIAKKHGVTSKQIEKALKKGTKIELEHTKDKAAAREIALDHLAELPDYYSRLEKIEKK